MLSKERIFRRIQEGLRKQISVAERAVEQARDGFWVGDDRAGNRGERGVIQESSWLLSAQASRLEELRRQLFAIEKATPKPQDTISPGALVSLKDIGSGELEIYLVHPELGGVEVELEGGNLLAISPASPLGAALLGKRAGDEVEVTLPAAVRRLKVLDVN